MTDSSQQEEGGEPEEYEWIPKTVSCYAVGEVPMWQPGSRQDHLWLREPSLDIALLPDFLVGYAI